MGRSRSRDKKRDRSRERRSRSHERRSRSRRRGSRSHERRSRSRRRGEEKTPAPAIEPEDLEFRPGRKVVVHGLQKNPEKNGSIGELVSFNKEKGRWLVEFSSSSNNFKEENLELMPDNGHLVNDNEEPPTAKLYITNLAAEVEQKDLIDLFKGIGVLAKETTRDSRGKVQGFSDQWPEAVKLYKPGRKDGDGSVEYQDKYAAKAAVKTFNGYRLKGSRIGVAYAGVGRKYENRELTLPWAQREENQGRIAQE